MRIVLLDDIGIGAEDICRLEEKGEVHVCSGVPSGDDEIVERARDAEVVISGWTKIGGEVIDSLPSLQLISLWATGLDNVGFAAASERNVMVCHVPSYATNAVAELALGLMLAVMRKMPAADQHLRRTHSSDWRPFQGGRAERQDARRRRHRCDRPALGPAGPLSRHEPPWSRPPALGGAGRRPRHEVCAVDRHLRRE